MPKATTVIDVEPSTRTGLRGRLDRLLQEFTMKAQAIKITAQILDEEDQKLALASAPQKFLQAINHRNSHAGRVPIEAVTSRGTIRKRVPRAENAARIAQYLQSHSNVTTQTIATALDINPNVVLDVARRVAKPTGNGYKGQLTWTLKTSKGTHAPMPRQKGKGRFKKASGHNGHQTNGHRVPNPIHGKALSLFLLEHLDETTPKPLDSLFSALADAGSPLNPKALNGPMNVALMRKGLVKRTTDGFRRTPKGADYAQQLRATLEAKGTVPSGGYIAASA